MKMMSKQGLAASKKARIVRVLTVLFLFCAMTQVALAGFRVHKEFTVTLQPGAWQGYNLGECSPRNAFVVGYTMLSNPSHDGYVEKTVIQPEWDGKTWNTVLRIQTPKAAPPMKVKVRVYDVSSAPVAQKRNVTLKPGEWTGFSLGPASLKSAYVTAVTPMTPVKSGFVEKIVTQAEFDGKNWNTVLRLQTSKDMPTVELNYVVYNLSGAPVANTIKADVKAGSWPGFSNGPTSVENAFVAAVSPVMASSNGAHVYPVIQPEFDGKTWNTAMRIQLPTPQPTLKLEGRTYRISR